MNAILHCGPDIVSVIAAVHLLVSRYAIGKLNFHGVLRYRSAVDWQTANATAWIRYQAHGSAASYQKYLFQATSDPTAAAVRSADWDCVDARQEIPVTQNWEARQSRRGRQRWPALAKSPISDCCCTFLNTAIIVSKALASYIRRADLAAMHLMRLR